MLKAINGDVNNHNELLNDFNEIIAQLNDLSDRAVNMHTGPEEMQAAKLDEIRKSLDDMKERFNVLEWKHERPVQLVLYPEALEMEPVRIQLENLERLLSEKKENLAVQLAVVALASKIAKEAAQLRESIENAENVENDAHVDAEKLESTIEDLEHARPHLEALQEAYEQMGDSPDTDTLRAQTLSQQSALGESYDAVKRALEDRLENLNHFNKEIANIDNQLSQLDDRVRDLGAPTADLEVSIIDDIMNTSNELCPISRELSNMAQSLSPLDEPLSRIDALIKRQDDLNNRVKVCSFIFYIFTHSSLLDIIVIVTIYLFGHS